MHEQGVLNSGHTNRYAFGLFIDEYRGTKMVEHGGGWAGYTSDIIRFPDQKVAVVLLANTSDLNAIQFSRQVADIVLFGAPLHEPNESQDPKSSPDPGTRVSTDTLDAYCGMYELKPGVVERITRQEDRLYAKFIGPRVELWPETENTFFIKEDGSRISFERDERGQVNRLKVQTKTKDPIFDTSTYVGQRIMPSRAPLRAEELTEFVGEYSSDELGTTYTILVRNGELLAHHRRLGDIPLTQTPGRDQFLGEGSCVTFARDARNQVTGFKWTILVSRNVRFDRRIETLPPDNSERREP
jgi:hypothetical protein